MNDAWEFYEPHPDIVTEYGIVGVDGAINRKSMKEERTEQEQQDILDLGDTESQRFQSAKLAQEVNTKLIKWRWVDDFAASAANAPTEVMMWYWVELKPGEQGYKKNAKARKKNAKARAHVRVDGKKFVEWAQNRSKNDVVAMLEKKRRKEQR